MRVLYRLIVNLYFLAIKLAAPFNSRASKWVKGRKNWQETFDAVAPKGKFWIWFHAASLGEFEQGRPVIEAIKKKYPGFKILLTFFSPSGYEVRKSYEHADHVAYLPPDSPRNALQMLNTFKPVAVFFIKYEFWFSYLQKIGIKSIPLFYISLKMRPEQYFFKNYGRWFLKQLSSVTYFFVQDRATAKLLNDRGYLNVKVAGDTRFDRVAAIAANAAALPDIEKFKGDNKLIALGSTWPSDEKMLFPIISKLPDNYKVIIAPHDVSTGHINQIMCQLKDDCERFSDTEKTLQKRFLLIDSIGILSQVYRYATFAYVGGGFGKAIHNIQEAVTYGCPVIIGPKHTKFTEAVDLVKSGGVFAVNNIQEMENAFKLLISNPQKQKEASLICRRYVQEQTGATAAIMKQIEPYLEVIR